MSKQREVMSPELIAQCESEGLKEYLVSLHEDKGDKFTIHFECWAEDEDHAADQAINAYPNGEITHIQIMP